MKLKHFFLFIIVSFLLSFSVISCGGNAKPDPVELDDTLTAMKLAKAMECGWNLGNTLDARGSWLPESKVFPFML